MTLVKTAPDHGKGKFLILILTKMERKNFQMDDGWNINKNMYNIVVGREEIMVSLNTIISPGNMRIFLSGSTVG